MVVYEKTLSESFNIVANDRIVWCFFIVFGMLLIFTDFPVVRMVETHFLLENLWISGAFLGTLGKFQHSLALPNIKYNCAIYIIFVSCVLIICVCFKIYFLIHHHCKTLKKSSHYCGSCRVFSGIAIRTDCFELSTGRAGESKCAG